MFSFQKRIFPRYFPSLSVSIHFVSFKNNQHLTETLQLQSGCDQHVWKFKLLQEHDGNKELLAFTELWNSVSFANFFLCPWWLLANEDLLLRTFQTISRIKGWKKSFSLLWLLCSLYRFANGNITFFVSFLLLCVISF